MNRRSFVKAVGLGAGGALASLALPATAQAFSVPEISMELLLRRVRYCLGYWKVVDRFEEDELREYIKCSIDWANAHLEYEDGRQLVEVNEDKLENHMEDELVLPWIEAIQWGALAHATFALEVNWMACDDPAEFREKARYLNVKAAAHHDKAIEWLMQEAEQVYELRSLS